MSVPAHLGYVALALLVGGESLGLLLPGEAALLAAGVLAHEGRLDVALVVAIAALAAIVGDNIGYVLGRRGGRMLLTVRGPLRERRRRALREGERFFARHGARAVFLGRWVAVARVTVPWFAGGSRMPWRTFLLLNALGGVSWVTTVVFAGYAFGAGAAVAFGSVGIALLGLVLVLAAAAAWRARRGRRAARDEHASDAGAGASGGGIARRVR